MRYGYNTNGFSFHRLEDAIAVLAECGYGAVALTLDVHHLDPLRASAADVERIRDVLRDHGMTVAIETGARFVLDPRRKHWPTLLDPDAALAERRASFLRTCLAIGERLGAEVLSFWSGARAAEVPPEGAWDRLAAFCAPFVAEASDRGVEACLEPEPGMFVESLRDFDRLRERVPGLRLALDVGHVFVTEDVPPERVLQTHRAHLGQITLDDARGRVHEHLVPGEGIADWTAILGQVRAIGHERPLYVELGRHGHDAVRTARDTLAFLRRHEPPA